jgi:A-macroglobulin TED domain/Alpha-2-macroglobulin family/MG2 domain/Carboxypeptidase regulatory-like domain/A-macroglobulin receptor binding domain/Macroglobulin domain MG3
MSRKWLLFLFCLSVLIALAPLSHASLTLKVNESATRVLFEEQGTRVLFEVENSLTQQVDGILKIEITDTDGVVRATAERETQVKPGRNSLTVPIALALKGKETTATRELLWYRLRYHFTPSKTSQFDPVNGLISLSEITPEIFALKVASSRKAQEGSAFRVRVQASHPLTSKGVAGVTLNAQMKFDGSDRDDVVLTQSARTDTTGFATLDFQIPRSVEDDEGELSIEGRRGILVETAKSDIELDRDAQILVTTDKPIYQPGQTLHIRVLTFDATRHALADEKATLKISDPESTTVFRTDLTTSRFGIANADWSISENIRLGDYRVNVELENDKYDGSYGAAMVKLSRYDLPNFTVNVKPDRPYYLPGQDAQVEVRADYLFGHPVKRGHVRVVRESERNWNYREQKWETEEGDKYEGNADTDGKFVAKIKFAEEHERLKDQDYSRYLDLTFAAYFTDASTNRTEQRRFDLRLTKDAIHVYVAGQDSRRSRLLPLEFYVSTSYADGTPASCEIAIAQTWNEDPLHRELALKTIRTNAYGIAKVSSLQLTQNSGDRDESLLTFRAHDTKGAVGTHAETFYLTDRPAVRVETAKSLYRDGEPILATIITSETDATIAVDVINEQKVLRSQLVHPQKGRATVTIPYQREFSGVVTVATYLTTTNEDDDTEHANRSVLYPHDNDLKFNLSLNQSSYRPGDEASASFLTRLANGRAAESALGVVIFDRAVEERARIDNEFGGSYGFSDSYCYLTSCGYRVAGVTRKDLDQIDLSKPLPDGLDLVAEILLTNYQFIPRLFASAEFDRDGAEVFADFFKGQIQPLKERLDTEYESDCSYPTEIASLRRLALLSAIDFNELRDPWETPYRTSFFAEGKSEILLMASAGGDQQFGTQDDFPVLRVERPYFRFIGQAIDRAVNRYHTRTGLFIRDAATLKTELRLEGIDFDALRDPWGQPYGLEFGVNQTKLVTHARSSGPDRQFSSHSQDDVPLWTSAIDYTRDIEAKTNLAMTAYFKSTGQIPQNKIDFQSALSRSGLKPEELRDPWGRPYYASFKQDAIYGNRVTIYNYAKYGEKPKEKTDVTPVTQQVNSIYMRSGGEDGTEGTYDDFNVASFSRIIAEQAGNESTPKPVQPAALLRGSTGAITGTVTDPNGATVRGATVTAKNKRTSLEFSSTSNDSGVYLIHNVPVGLYEVRINSPGFSDFLLDQVPVRSSSITRADGSLSLGTMTSTVSVVSESVTVEASQSASLTTVVHRGLRSGAVLNQASTPRLREYFPETLVWQPSLETDKQGRAQLKFKLADNITTWKMSVIASTEDGQIGSIEKDIKSFQPFFVEHDPPRILTEGDEISLPVVVRNYLERSQPISLEIKPENWFSLLGPGVKRTQVPAGDATRETFDFRATASVKDGKQRLTAIGADANDAIEKPVTVHPDGEEKSVTASNIVSDNAILNLDIPATAVPGSTHAELKIYPNLLAHVAESVEAIMKRPYGCGEQTISSTYPSLLLLRHYKRLNSAAGSSGQGSLLTAKAERYLRAGYNRLLNYRDESGGFTYWGRGNPDLALTAYALRFLSEARGLIAVNDDVINEARAWLIKQQRADGSWAAYDYWDKNENKRRSAMLTAYIARVLAMTAEVAKPASQPNQSVTTGVVEQKRALDFLAARIDEIDEPYLIASYALAALEVGDRTRTEKASAKLRALAHDENGASFWSLESNTPFYGWGIAGRVETAALVVQALSRSDSEPGVGATGSNQKLVDRGLLFLLREKDSFGVWYSTQATINVLDAMLGLLARDVSAGASTLAEVLVNGRRVQSVTLPPANQLTSPITIDLSQFVQRGANQIELKRSSGSSPASAQAVATYYLPWSESIATQEANWRASGSSGLRLTAKFNKTESKVSDEITCHVEAERIGFRGYGMMLAEIGLPPGADVDRASLEKAMKGSDWSISQYDVLPDRVVVYLWPRAGGTKFDFNFRPRFGVKAQTAASTVYDYYNPESRAVVAPARFVVK